MNATKEWEILIRGIDSNGKIVRESYPDPEYQSEIDSTVAAMSERPEIVRIVIDIALPRK